MRALLVSDRALGSRTHRALHEPLALLRLVLRPLPTSGEASGPSQRRDHDGLEADVLSSTGAGAYKVRIGGRTPYACECPDFVSRGGMCKHIIYIMHYVLQWNIEQIVQFATYPERIFDQDAHLRECVSRGRPRRPETRADTRTLTIAEDLASTDVETSEGGREVREDDGCPICFVPFGASKKSLTFCPSCRNVFHKKCIGIWLQRKDACPLCRAPWIKRV